MGGRARARWSLVGYWGVAARRVRLWEDRADRKERHAIGVSETIRNNRVTTRENPNRTEVADRKWEEAGRAWARKGQSRM